MSSRSNFVLDNYVNNNSYDIVAVQEIETSDIDRLKLTNMRVITDPNHSANKGAALYINEQFSLTPLIELSKLSKHLDTSWGLAVIGNKRYIVASIYLKLNYPEGVQEILNMMQAADEMAKRLRSSGIIVVGDFNARHTAWGDRINNDYGKQLVEKLDYTKFSICHSNSPTFLAANGSSVIDLMIVSNNLSDSSTCITDDQVELYSGAPLRGHVPLISTITTRADIQQNVTEKLCIKNVKWEEWSKDLDMIVEKDNTIINTIDDPHHLWNYIDDTIKKVTLKHCEMKLTSKHSKPYWTPMLSTLAKKLRKSSKAYIKRNTDHNKEKLLEAKEHFDKERKRECQEFIIKTTKDLNSAQATKFWKRFNSLFKKKSDNNIDPLSNGNGGLYTDPSDMENTLFATFFEATHLSAGNFDDEFYNTVTNIYEEIRSEDISFEETGVENEGGISNQNVANCLNFKISLKEIKKSIKNTQANGKSFDNHNLHPLMLQHLGSKFLKLIKKLFNSCLSKNTWVWNDAEVIFFRKEGKENYSMPGSYRPISISSYIGKLLEKIIAKRISTYLTQQHIFDPDQEGFTPARNTIRYLNRLVLGIKGDLEKKLSVLCLFIDFEKAFDSVWKKGLIYKLHKIGIHGNILKLIHSFLFSRNVSLNINGNCGPKRACMDYGLPQGSALSPILFKIYLLDLADEMIDNPDVEVLKFADDGTIKVHGHTISRCLETMNEILRCLKVWTASWRMIINCQPNKTEMMCFSKTDGTNTQIPDRFQLGDKEIKLVSHTKVLGLIIDESLSFNLHSKSVYNKILGRWANICKYSNIHWGLCQRVMVQLMKTLFISSICYAGLIWIKPTNTAEVDKIWYKIVKSSVGAVFNISRSLAEIILGLPPLKILNHINRIKHYLKLILCPTPGDRLLEFIINCNVDETKCPLDLWNNFKEVYKFLRWKLNLFPEQFNENDTDIISNGTVNRYSELSPKSCSYTKVNINAYTQVLWERSVKIEYQLEGKHHYPSPRCSNLPIPLNTSRESEVKLMSLFYPNNLFNSFLYCVSRVASPRCVECLRDEHTPYHIVMDCPAVDEVYRSAAKEILTDIIGNEEIKQEDTVTLLNGSREAEFILVCLNIIDSVTVLTSIDLDVDLYRV